MPNTKDNRPRYGLGAIPRPEKDPDTGRWVLPPEQQALYNKKLADNGLAYREINCKRCGFHICDGAVLIGVIRYKCPKCKFVEEPEFNRVGEQEELEAYHNSNRSTGGVDSGKATNG